MWVKIFLKRIQVGDYSLIERRITKGKVLVRSWCQNLFNATLWKLSSDLIARTTYEYKACILGLKMTIDMNVHEFLVIGDSDILIHQVQGEWGVKKPKIIPYVQYVQKLCKRFHKIKFRHTPRIQNELDDALLTIASMIKHPDTDYIDPLHIEMKEHPVHSSHV